MIHHTEYQDSHVDIRALPDGMELLDGQYRIDHYLSSGGFGITYLATDSLGRRVVIKECFPEALCSRNGKTVRAKSTRHMNEFNAVVDMFVREARSLAKLDHPHIVGVHQIFRTHDTAYMALDYIDGHDTLRLLETGPGQLSHDTVLTLTECLLDAISAVHDADMLHRDISPDNILIDQEGKPCLIDFGAARQEATKKSRAISALLMVKDGYSPQEFYISGGDQGPASDLYSLGATLHHLITGEVPPNSQNRLAALAARKPDPFEPLEGRVKEYDPNFLRAIDLAMSVFPKDRPQTAEQWIAIATGSFIGPAGQEDLVGTIIPDLVDEVAQSIEQDRQAENSTTKDPVETTQIVLDKAPEDDRWWPLTEQIDQDLAVAARDDVVEADVSTDGEPAPIVQVEPRRLRRRLSALVLIGALTFGYQENWSDYQLNGLSADIETFIGSMTSDDPQT